MSTVRIFCPAKINVFLAVTGRRADGFHDLVSLVLPLDWGDDLEVEAGAETTRGIEIECADPDVPAGSENLIWKAAEAFFRATGHEGRFRFRLTKRIPMGAGLGGGSSDAVGALVGMNRLTGEPLDRAALSALAAGLGSDCPLFLHGRPVVLEGRGERIEPVSDDVCRALRDLKVLLFKPAFSIGTAWAYGELARRAPAGYLDEGEAKDRLRALLAAPHRLPEWGFNSFEAAVGDKFPAIPLLLQRLRKEGTRCVLMSGSGSACFAIGSSRSDLDPLRQTVQECWGEGGLLEIVGLGGVGPEDGHPGADG